MGTSQAPETGTVASPEEEPVMATDHRIDPDQFLLSGIDTSKEPHFSVSEFGKIFFARSPHWVRLQDNDGKFVLDGRRVGTSRTAKGSRYYTLTDIEECAHALAANGVINGAQLRRALALVAVESEVWGFR